MPNLLQARENLHPALVAGKGDDRFEKMAARFGTVNDSPDYRRIAALPRRTLPDSPEFIESVSAPLRREGGTQTLRKLQAQVLWEAPRIGGYFANLSLGAGKTLLGLLMPMVWPNCKRAVLFVPAKLRIQLFEQDIPFYGKHWKLPTIVDTQWVHPGRPVLHVVTYNEISSPKRPKILEQINPDLLLCDEIHRFKNLKTATGTKRFFKFLAAHSDRYVCGWTGTPMTTSIRDFAFLMAAMLGDGSPVPFNEPALGEWASVLDPGLRLTDPGVLRSFCRPGESAREGFHRRMIDTAGVVASPANEVGAELTYYERKAPPMPQRIIECLRMVHATEPKRPDGEILLTPLDEVRCARQLAAGFYMRWRFPRGEPEDLILDWFSVRQMWNRELREKLKRADDHLDSDKLCRNAADRFYNGGCTGCNRRAKEPHAPGCSQAATHPLWESYTWLEWKAIKDRVYHETQTVWESDFLLKDAAQWALEEPGIIWVEFIEFGHELSRRTKLPYYGEGEEAARGIAREDGRRSVILSKANSEGLNLQDRFYRNLFITFPSDAKAAGQMVGRTHREGQRKDEVEVYFYAHTAELREGIVAARSKAECSSENWDTHKLSAGQWLSLDEQARLARTGGL